MEFEDWILLGFIAVAWLAFLVMICNLCAAGATYDDLMGRAPVAIEQDLGYDADTWRVNP